MIDHTPPTSPSAPDQEGLTRPDHRHLRQQHAGHRAGERERALAGEADEADTAPAAAWSRTATGLVDAVMGIWLAPPTDDSETRS